MGAIEIDDAKAALVERLTKAAHAAATTIGTSAVAVLQHRGLEAGRRVIPLLGPDAADVRTEIAALCSALHEFEAIIALVETQPSSRVSGPTIDLGNSEQYDPAGTALSQRRLRGWYRILADYLRDSQLCVALEPEEDGSPYAVLVIRSC